MNRKLLFLVLLFCMLASSGCVCQPPGISSVSVNLYPQHRNWWCWAAATEMISNYYSHRVLQADSANFVHGQPPDCAVGCDCWGGGWGAGIGDIQNNWTHWNFTYTYVANSLSWDDLKSSIACGRSPIMTIWWWSGGGGHVVVAYGYADTDVGDFVSYRDPWPPDFTQAANVANDCPTQAGGGDHVTTYAAYVNDGAHNWGNTFHRFSYQAP